VRRTTERFWRCFENLTDPVQKISKKNFELLKNNPAHPLSISRKLAHSGQPALE
jgi:hypothetical protein